MSCQSFLDGSAGRWSSAERMSRTARVPALNVICSAAARVSAWRHSCWRRRRWSWPCLARIAACWCSFSSKRAMARSRRSAACGFAWAWSRSTSASRRSPRHRATTSSGGRSDAESCSSSVASVSSLAVAASASRRRRSLSSNVRHASWKRRVSGAAYSDGIGGRLSHWTLSSAIRSAPAAPVRPSISSQIALRSACSRAIVRARSSSAARSC